jgi:hypothetical protein
MVIIYYILYIYNIYTSENGDVNRENWNINPGICWDCFCIFRRSHVDVFLGAGVWGNQICQARIGELSPLIHHQNGQFQGSPAGTASAFSSRRHDRGLCIPRNEPGFTPFAKASGRSGDQGEVSMV